MDHAAAAELFALTDRELWLITAAAGERRGGLIATFVSHASLVPELPRILIAVAKQHHTWQLIEASGAFGAHLLAERHLELVWRFGLPSGRDLDKLDGLAIEHGASASPLISETLGWLDCRVETRLDTGDRTVYVAEVLAARRLLDEPPLTAKRMLELAPPDKLRQLRELRERDSAVDADAIRAWRRK
ncbi:MAG TPA: flavin reductase family protein [Pirellulales bacterium]|nr:flavin reductase family protein [Pirellulales bacterium]